MARPTDQNRKAARLMGARFYSGPPCREGHGAEAGSVERYTSTGVCRLCVQGQQRPDRITTPRRVCVPASLEPLAALFG